MIKDPQRYFDELGQLHDAQLTRIRWDSKGQVIELSIDDYSASIDEDDKPGVQGGWLFAGVSNALGVLDDYDWNISEFSVAGSGDTWQANLILKSGATLTWIFESVVWVEP